eukprot:2929237-Prymnesium_polylepis.1
MTQRGDPVRVTVICHFWVARNGPGSEIIIARSSSAILDRKAVFIEPRPPVPNCLRPQTWWWTGGGGGGWQ